MRDRLENKLEVGDKVLCVVRAQYLEKAIITELREYVPGCFSADVKYESGRIAYRKVPYQIIKILW